MIYSSICYNKFVAWKDFVEEKYLEWRKDKRGRAGSTAAFSRMVGVSPQIMNGWINGGQRPSAANLPLAVNAFGDDVYSVLGIEIPIGSEFSLLPESVKIALLSAIEEARIRANKRNITVGSAEFDDLLSEIFNEWGWIDKSKEVPKIRK